MRRWIVIGGLVPIGEDATARERSTLSDADGLISGLQCPLNVNIYARGLSVDARPNVLEVVGWGVVCCWPSTFLLCSSLENVEGLFNCAIDRYERYGHMNKQY